MVHFVARSGLQCINQGNLKGIAEPLSLNKFLNPNFWLLSKPICRIRFVLVRQKVGFSIKYFELPIFRNVPITFFNVISLTAEAYKSILLSMTIGLTFIKLSFEFPFPSQNPFSCHYKSQSTDCSTVLQFHSILN